MTLDNQVMRQNLALIRRYLINLQQTPIRSLFRNLLWPCLVTFGTIYVITSIDNPKLRLIAGTPNLYCFRLTIFPAWHFTEWLISERTTGMKSLLISMGLKRSSFYLANTICFMAFIVPYLIVATIIDIIYIFPESKSGPIAISILFTIFMIQMTALVFASSLILNTPIKAFITPAILNLDIFLTHRLITWLMKHSSKSWWNIILFIGGCSPLESMRIFVDSYVLCKNCNETILSEQINLYQKTNLISHPTYLILASMVFWSIIYCAFIYLIDRFEPKRDVASNRSRWLQFGSSCPWLYSPILNEELSSQENRERIGEANFEKRDTTNLQVGFSLKGLTKIYNSTTVVDNITFDVYKGETTLLLGHNGAGKTTLMNMILGQLRPDKGEVIMMNDSAGFGVCPQDSVLDDKLSVRQHLKFLADIKLSKLRGPELEEDIRRTIEEVGLAEQIGMRPTEMSGGMKRKLSLAMAAVGGSGILVLDEPSSGIDPESRSSIWEVIRRFRTNRIVLLSTQHMEEADYLGDRVAIMSSGRIICCGSSTFLTNTFGYGYKLRVECRAANIESVLDFVRRYFSSAKLGENQQASSSLAAKLDLIIELDDKTKTVKQKEESLIEMLENIEANSTELGIESHGLRSPSIEDVLLNTNKSDQVAAGEVLLTISPTTESQIAKLLELSQKTTTISSFACLSKRFSHFRAFVIKQMHYYRRDWAAILLLRIVLPCLGMWSLVRDFNYYIVTDLPRDYLTSLANLLMILHLIYYPTLERVSKFKIMQLASQANFLTYWLAQFVVDQTLMILLVIVGNVMLATLFDGEILISSLDFHLIVTLAIILFFISASLLAYVLSTIFNSANSAIGKHILCYSMPAAVLIIRLIIAGIAKDPLEGFKRISDRLFVALLPTESIEYMIYGFASKCYIQEKGGSCEESDEFSPVTLGFICLYAQIFLYSVLLCIIECNNLDPSSWGNSIAACFWCKRAELQASIAVQSSLPVDEDVLGESAKVEQLLTSKSDSHELVVSKLCKSYVKGIQVIKKLSFAVRRRECFGLLGVNGAGKSTVFSMISTDANPDSGSLKVNGFNSISETTKYRSQLGYDPQSSPEVPLSPSEALHLMARLRDVEEKAIAELVRVILQLLEMDQHGNKSIDTLSGGTKRKLALGIGLIGRPQLLALDEPTSGIDPIARRKIWQLLRSLCSQADVTIVISSQAMEECEAICDRIAIMMRGEFRCVGSFLHLRSKFLHSFIVKVQIAGSLVNVNEIKELLSELDQSLKAEFGAESIKLLDTQIRGATFEIADSVAKRSNILKALKKFKELHPNVSYLLNDTSLEDIFLFLAREQRGGHARPDQIN